MLLQLKRQNRMAKPAVRGKQRQAGFFQYINRRTAVKDVEQAIRESAYHLWIESGCRHGQSDQHWLAAQRSILGALLGAKDQAEAKPKKTRAARKKRAA
jgi:hypothetical protein